jgi:putative heme-binding domain-containing protein
MVALTYGRMRARTVAILAGVILVWAGGAARAQHATAFDIEDGGRAFASNCAACHGPDGDLIGGIDLGRGLFRRPLTDAELVGIIMNGIPNTPMPATPRMTEPQAARIVAYLRATAESSRSTAAQGNATRGRMIFEGKGECTDCHRVNGWGSRYGPDLSRIGLARRAAELEQSLIDPEAEVQPTNRFYSVTTAGGDETTGRLLNHDTFTVQLLDGDEELRTFMKADLRAHGFIDTPMPSYRDELDAQEIVDVVSYLVSLRGEPAR